MDENIEIYNLQKIIVRRHKLVEGPIKFSQVHNKAK